MYITILAIIGIILSVYILYVQSRVKKSKRDGTKYQAACDINDKYSCTGVVVTKYGRVLYLSNALIGIMFYLLVIILEQLKQNKEIIYLSYFAVLFSAYLFFTANYKLKKQCIVCNITHIINILILAIAYGFF